MTTPFAASASSVRIYDTRTRHVPIPLLNVTATTSGAAQTLFTVEDGSVSMIDRLTVTNTTGTAATLTLHMIPDGDSIGNTNKELDAHNVPANMTLRIDGLLGGTYPPDHVCKVYSGTNGALTLRGALVQER